jgi:Cof subfamily protein (haloacid dehalogenase superfamily)
MDHSIGNTISCQTPIGSNGISAIDIQLQLLNDRFDSGIDSARCDRNLNPTLLEHNQSIDVGLRDTTLRTKQGVVDIGYQEFDHGVHYTTLECYNQCMTLPRMLFFDLDNTLLDTTTHAIPGSTLAALNTLHQRGFGICIATGRSLPLVKSLQIEDKVPWKLYVLNNGQMILDQDQCILRWHHFSTTTVNQVLARAKALSITVFLGSPKGDLLIGELNTYVSTANGFFKEPIPEAGHYDDRPIDKIILYESIDYDWSAFSDINGIDIHQTMTTSADTVVAGVSKHASIHEALMLLDLPDYYIAFGDSLNDVEMLKHAPISVAMANGVDEVKRIAHYIAQPVHDDGIVKMLKQLHFLD